MCIVLILSLLITITACQGIRAKTSAGAGVVKPGENKLPEITILVTANIANGMKNDYFVSYEKQFEKQYGVKVNYEVYGGFYENDAGELMTKLIIKNGPELIIDDSVNARSLIKQGAVLDVRNKIENISKIYAPLVGSKAYFIPIGISYQPIVLRKDMLEELQLPAPELNWTAEDYYSMRDKWLGQSERIFSSFDLNQTVYKYLRKLELFDFINKKANINTQELKNALSYIKKDIFSGNYILNEDYTYKNYYNMLFEYTSQEFIEDTKLQLSKGYEEQNFRSRRDENINMLYARDIDLKRLVRLVVLPDSISEENYLSSLGYMANKNGANLELAYEFVNGLLSDEMQLQMYEYEGSRIYPVNKDIESKIADIEKSEGYSEEALQLKKFILDKIKIGEFQLFELRDMKKDDLYWMLIKDILQYIFADKRYTDAQLSTELQKLENKYNIILSE